MVGIRDTESVRVRVIVFLFLNTVFIKNYSPSNYCNGVLVKGFSSQAV